MPSKELLERQLHDYERILEIGVELASTLDLERVLDLALAKAEELCRAETSSIWELDDETGELFFRVVRGRAAGAIRDLRVELGQGIVGAVAQSGEAELVPTAADDPRWHGDRSSDFVTRSLVAVPLIARGSVIGVLQLVNAVGRDAFSPEDLRRMQLLAGPLANAVENARLHAERKRTMLQTVLALSEAVDHRDPYTGGHIRRVVGYSLVVGQRLGLCVEQLEELELAAVLHDIGKLSTPDHILSKPEPLARDERRIMSRHPVDGARIIAPMSAFEEVRRGVRHHHEHIDGSGYPDGLAGDEIPLFARIIAVADAFDAMTTDRPYRGRMAVDEALDEIERSTGRQFCPSVAPLLVAAVRAGEIVASETTDESSSQAAG